MKNLFSVFVFSVLLVVFTADVNAQDDKKEERVGGIRFGWHQSAYYEDGNAVSDADPMQSFYIGFFKNTKLASLFSFGSGIEYFQNGVNYSGDNKLALHYVSVPLNLNLNIGPVFALSGFAPSLKVAERIVTDGNSVKPTDDLKSEWFDIPFYVGAGVKILFITVEARYHWGLLEVNNGLNSRYFQLGAGLSF